MEQKKILWKMIVVILIVTFTGCAKKPDSTMKDGVSFAEYSSGEENRSEEEIDVETVQNTKKSLFEEMAKTVETEIVVNDSKMKIDAQVKNIPEDGNVFTGEYRYQKLDVEKLKDVFFEHRASEKGIDNGSSVKSTSWSLMDETGEKTLASLEISGDGENEVFYYYNHELNAKYPTDSMNSSASLGEVDAPNTTLTREGAMEMLEERIKEIDGPEIKIHDCIASQTDNGKGYYQLKFSPVFHGVEIAIDVPGSDIMGQYMVFGNAIITEDGIMEFRGSFMIEYAEEKEVEKVLTDQEIIQTVTKYMENEMIMIPGLTVNEIRFEYAAINQGQKRVIIPIWHLYYDESTIDKQGFLITLHGVGIEACHGDLLFTI